jgi:hypothetical protein
MKKDKKPLKRGYLSESEKKYISKNRDKDIVFICNKTNRSEEVIEKYIEEVKKAELEEKANARIVADSQPKVAVNETENLTTSDLFARNKKWGVTIMTEAAAMKSDETRPKTVNVKQNSFIHKIRKED